MKRGLVKSGKLEISLYYYVRAIEKLIHMYGCRIHATMPVHHNKESSKWTVLFGRWKWLGVRYNFILSWLWSVCVPLHSMWNMNISKNECQWLKCKKKKLNNGVVFIGKWGHLKNECWYWNKKTFYAVIFGTVMYDVRSWLILDRLRCNHSCVRNLTKWWF